ncbi:hypothetical protein [Sphingobium cupriresistens]|uniref:Gene transfer agent protein n=1 Tax=Sphingobium cupriresistens LL01 TaxID=1420583 RepID=A0A0J7XS72_9SPHN|nr:hypothetical protein [Sphingobium cupriresistens]KMS54721.1 hypothetical protein V473_15395 [Sphingobium cupriresistens LL01]
MPNPLRGQASFKAGASEFTLVFDINTFCELEDETGLGVADLVEQIQDKPSFKLLRSIFCAGLQAHHPQTSIVEAGEIMSDAGLDVMKDALARALKAAMPAPSDDTASAEGKVKPARKRGGTGSNS